MLEQKCVMLENRIRVHYQKLSLIDGLSTMGLGFNYLIFIYREIAAENGIIYSLAVEQFFESLERQYDIKLKLWNM